MLTPIVRSVSTAQLLNIVTDNNPPLADYILKTPGTSFFFFLFFLLFFFSVLVKSTESQRTMQIPYCLRFTSFLSFALEHVQTLQTLLANQASNLYLRLLVAGTLLVCGDHKKCVVIISTGSLFSFACPRPLISLSSSCLSLSLLFPRFRPSSFSCRYYVQHQPRWDSY